jgi:hypothetical protein
MYQSLPYPLAWAKDFRVRRRRLLRYGYMYCFQLTALIYRVPIVLHACIDPGCIVLPYVLFVGILSKFRNIRGSRR